MTGPFAVNLGGEGEEPGALNRQPPHMFSPDRGTARDVSDGGAGPDYATVLRRGHDFLLCPNDRLALPDGCVDRVFTNGVPIFPCTFSAPVNHLGPVVRFDELERVLKPGGRWFHNEDEVTWTRGVPPKLPDP